MDQDASPAVDALLLALRQRDPAAFEQLFATYADKIYRLAAGLLGNDEEAEGVVQDSFLRLFEKLDGFEGRSSLGTWLYRVAYNLSIDLIRARRPTVPLADEPDEDDSMPSPAILTDWTNAPDRVMDDTELAEVLDRAIDSLPEIYRAIFILREIDQLSVEETAAIAGISGGAVKVRHHRARLMLREHLAESFAIHV